MDKLRIEEQIQQRKEEFLPGTLVELVEMRGEEERLPCGSVGVVVCVDDMGTVHCRWENGSTLGVATEDICRRIGMQNAMTEKELLRYAYRRFSTAFRAEHGITDEDIRKSYSEFWAYILKEKNVILFQDYLETFGYVGKSLKHPSMQDFEKTDFRNAAEMEKLLPALVFAEYQRGLQFAES